MYITRTNRYKQDIEYKGIRDKGIYTAKPIRKTPMTTKTLSHRHFPIKHYGIKIISVAH